MLKNIAATLLFTASLFAGGLFTARAASAVVTWPNDKLYVSAEWLSDQLANDDLVLLHVGAENYYRASHIQGARFVHLDAFAHKDSSPDALTLELPTAEELRPNLEQLGISDRSKIVVYFDGGMIPPTTRVIFTLNAAGMGNRVRLLDGGYAAWQAGAYPTTSSVPMVTPGTLSPFEMHAPIVDAAFVQSHLSAAGYRVIDARAPDFYDGRKTGGSIQQPHLTGHIAGAASVPFSSVTGADQKLKSADEILKAFKAAGLKKGDKAIVYCHIGQQASVIAFAARSVGIDALLYDGSFQDWSRRNLPVETGAGK